MAEPGKGANPRDIATKLLTHYSFDLGTFTVDQLIDHWSKYYPSQWIQVAVVEALYQGRYKAVSVEQILTLWYRRGRPLYHFNSEFERIVCGQFWEAASKSEASAPDLSEASSSDRPPYPPETLPLPAKRDPVASSVESALEEQSLDILRFSQKTSDSQVLVEVTTVKLQEGDRALTAAEEAQIKPSIQIFRPNGTTAPGASILTARAEQPDQPLIHQPIHQFVPTTDPDQVYTKLKAVLDTPPPPSTAASDRSESRAHDSQTRDPADDAT